MRDVMYHIASVIALDAKGHESKGRGRLVVTTSPRGGAVSCDDAVL